MTQNRECTKSLKPWFRLHHDGDRLIFHYGDVIISFQGRAATKLIPSLLPVLDGRHTIEEIQAAVEGDLRPAVPAAVGLLEQHGLLIPGENPEADTALARTAVFFSSIGGVGSVTEVQERISAAKFVVMGSSGLASEILRGFRSSGVGVAEASELVRFKNTTADLVIAAPSNSEIAHLREINVQAMERKQPWLQVLPYNGRFGAVGPLFIPRETACYACYLLRRAANVEYPEEYQLLDKAVSQFEQCAPLDMTLAGLAVLGALRWLGAQDPALVGTMMAYHPLGDRAISVHPVLRVPRCSVCYQATNSPPPSPWFDD